LVGREAELDRINALLRGARRGDGAAVVVVGEPGIGKTALLEAAVRSADMRTLRTAGLEAESNLPFAAVAELTEPLLGGLGELPEPQAAAIQGALALAPPTQGERFAACAGFLGLLEIAAAEAPVMVVVDDAQWLDRASAECIGYAARRLMGEPVVLIAAARANEPHPLTGPKISQLTLAGLDHGAARALLSEIDPTLPAPVADALVEAAAGNALALLELPSLLTPEQRQGLAPLARPLPAGVSLQRAFEQRIGRLPADAREACVVVAVAFTAELATIQAACRELEIDPAALERAEAAGIVELSWDRVAFVHPLLRGAVHQLASGAAQRASHRALAQHSADEDARAWHLAAAIIGPDADVAAMLEAAAGRATARGAHGEAADALERAARLTENRELRTRRLLAAGVAAAIGGAYDRGTALMELAEGIDDTATRAAVRHLLGLTSLNGGVRAAGDTHAMLIEEAESLSAIDAEAAAAMFADAGVAAGVAGNSRLVLESARRAQEILPASARSPVRCQVLSILGMGLALRGDAAAGRGALDEAGDLFEGIDPLVPVAQSIAFALGGRRCTGQDRTLLAEAAKLEAAAREAGAAGLFPYYQVLVADCAHRLGDWEAAERDIVAAAEGAEEAGQTGSLAIALAIAARVHAGRGAESEARAAVERAVSLAEAHAYGSAYGWARAAMGFLELSLGRVPEAIDELELVERLLEMGGLEDPLIIPWAPDLVEAYVRGGRLDEARLRSQAFSQRAQRNGAPLALALAERCEGLVADEQFVDAFERALEAHDEAEAPFERARTLLAFGSRLHRSRQRARARDVLREAENEFERLQALPWLQRARDELRAAGGVEREPIGDPDELTAQELRVALAVARGAKNREVAAELFLSPKTVEFHLGRVYRKLNIHSRAELATLVASGALEPGHAEQA
jgi:DNA-binding CsgD family transcriptional regulator